MYRAGHPMLGARLFAAAGLVRPGKKVADIGCDHGKLAVYLAQNGAPHVIAADIRPLPLAKAKALVQQTNCAGRVECRLGDGLAAIQPGEAEDIVIAGMGGESIAAILAAAPWTKDKNLHFVLVPATRGAELRRWLYQNGFALHAEVPVEERGRYYTAMSAAYTGECKEPSPLFCELGLLTETAGPAARGYIQKRMEALRKKGRAPLGETERQELDNLLEEMSECLR